MWENDQNNLIERIALYLQDNSVVSCFLLNQNTQIA